MQKNTVKIPANRSGQGEPVWAQGELYPYRPTDNGDRKLNGHGRTRITRQVKIGDEIVTVTYYRGKSSPHKNQIAFRNR